MPTRRPQRLPARSARRLVLMTDINGLMRDVKDPDSLISVLTTEDIGPLKEQGVISGGMIPKIDCALHAIESGVERVAMINGTLPHSILVEMLTKGRHRYPRQDRTPHCCVRLSGRTTNRIL